MITLEETPANVFFAGNPALYKVISSNFLSQTGRKCSFSLVVTAGDTTPAIQSALPLPTKH